MAFGAMLGAMTVVAAPIPEGWFAFPMVAGPGPLGGADASFLNTAPAGSAGFVTIRDGHFVDGAGNRLRFFATNLTATACFPAPEAAPRLARRLAALGFNLIRLHFMDIEKPHGLFESDRVTFAPEQLDRLDRLVAALKAAGIHVNLNLHVARRYPGIDGEAATRFGFGKVLDRFHPPFIEAQVDYAKRLLGHVNPYTGNAYAQEPAVAMIELNNENTLLPFWGGSLDDLPEPFAGELLRQWNDWLKKRYGTEASLRKAWSRGERPDGPDLLGGADGWTAESSGGAAATLTPTTRGLRWTATREGSAGWHLQFMRRDLTLVGGEDYAFAFRYRSDVPVTVTAMLAVPPWSGLGLSADLPASPEWSARTLRFRAGDSGGPRARLNLSSNNATGFAELESPVLRLAGRAALAKDESLARGTVRSRAAGGTDAAGRDWWAFLASTERATTRRLVRLLKDELKVRVPITDTQADYGGAAGILREAGESDYLDAHAYWEHPHFPKGSWDPEIWTIGNRSQVRSASGGVLADLALARVAGKPFTISEYNTPNPSDFGAETIPLLAAVAAFQDWDAVFPYSYMDFKQAWDTDRLPGFFDLAGNPGKLVFAPACAIAFRSGLVAAGGTPVTLTLPASAAPELLATGRQGLRSLWQAAGVDAGAVTRRRLAIRVDPAATLSATSEPVAAGATRASDTGELTWTPGGTDPRFTVNAPAFRLAAGELAGRAVTLGDLTCTFSRWSSGHAVLAAVALDGTPLAAARKIMVCVAARVENQGMGWNADRSSVGRNWGEGPVIAERVPVEVALPGTGWTARPLDGNGAPRRALRSRAQGGRTTLALNAPGTDSSLWFLIERSTP